MNENVLWWLLSFSETAVGLLLFCWLEPSPAEDQLSGLYQVAPDGYHNTVNAESGQDPSVVLQPLSSHCLMPWCL